MDDVARQLYPGDIINETVYLCEDPSVQEKVNPTVFQYDSLLRGNAPTIQKCHVSPADGATLPVKQPAPVLIPTATTIGDPISAPTRSEAASTEATSTTSDEGWPGTDPTLAEIERANNGFHDEPPTPPAEQNGSDKSSSRSRALRFDSSFESGNLRAAYRVSQKI